MDQQTIIADFEARAKAAGVTIGELCRQAGVNQVTFSKWKQSERNPVPMNATLGSIGKIARALDVIEAGDASNSPRKKGALVR